MADGFHRVVALAADPLFLAGVLAMVETFAALYLLRRYPIGRFASQIAFLFALSALLSSAGVVPYKSTPAIDDMTRYVLIVVFKTIWWLAAAWLITGFFHIFAVFERQPEETRFLQDIFAGLIYLGVLFAIATYAFDVPIGGLLATSGVIAVVLGLALQNTLGDVFSGLTLNFSKPYRPGDWIIVDSQLQGRVVETNWRATHIVTSGNDLAIVPNSILARSKIINTSRPIGAHGVRVVMQLGPSAMPSRACAMIEMALLNCTQILRDPKAIVTVTDISAAAIELEIYFFVTDIEDAPSAQNEFFDLAYRHCDAAAVRLAGPQARLIGISRPTRVLPQDRTRRLLDTLPIFASLSDDERMTLASRAKRHVYKAGDVVLISGTVVHFLSVLSSGVLAVLHQHENKDVELSRLGPGDCFGEGSLLSGAESAVTIKALTRATVYDFAKDDLARILTEPSGMATELRQLAARRAHARTESNLEREEKLESLGDVIADNMRRFLHPDGGGAAVSGRPARQSRRRRKISIPGK